MERKCFTYACILTLILFLLSHLHTIVRETDEGEIFVKIKHSLFVVRPTPDHP